MQLLTLNYSDLCLPPRSIIAAMLIRSTFDLADYMAHNRMPAPCLSTKDPHDIRCQQQQASPDQSILNGHLHALGKYAAACANTMHP